MPRCEAGRYHRAPGLIWLILDRDGERLLNAADGEDGVVEGRFGFLDLPVRGPLGRAHHRRQGEGGLQAALSLRPTWPDACSTTSRASRRWARTITSAARAPSMPTFEERSTHEHLPSATAAGSCLPLRQGQGAYRCRATEYGPAHARFATPALNLDELVWSRREPDRPSTCHWPRSWTCWKPTGERLTRDPRRPARRGAGVQRAHEPSAAQRARALVCRAGAGVQSAQHGVPGARGARRRRRARRLARRVTDAPSGRIAPHARLSAAPDPRDRRQRAGRRGDVGGARRADQGRAPVQAAVQRPVLGHRDPAHDGCGGAGPSAGAIVLGRLLARGGDAKVEGC